MDSQLEGILQLSANEGPHVEFHGTATECVVDSCWTQRHGPFCTGIQAVATSAAQYDAYDTMKLKVHERSSIANGESC